MKTKILIIALTGFLFCATSCKKEDTCKNCGVFFNITASGSELDDLNATSMMLYQMSFEDYMNSAYAATREELCGDQLTQAENDLSALNDLNGWGSGIDQGGYTIKYDCR